MWRCVPHRQHLDSIALTEGPSTHSPADTTTDHSPEGEWKEVVSKKEKKLSMSPRKPASPVKLKEDSSMGQGRKSPSPPPKKPRVVASARTGQGEVDHYKRTRVSTSREI